MMSMTATPTVHATHPITDRVRKHKDGSVLLSITEDRICKLNGVGALTWMVLEDIPVSLSLDEIIGALEERFEAINAEGELRYEVPHDRLRQDTSRFLEKMVSMRLLQVSRNSPGLEFYSINEDVSGSTTTSPDAPLDIGTDREDGCENIDVSWRETLGAFVGLLTFDVLLRCAGFRYLIKKVESWPTAEPRSTDREICRRVRAMVDRAQMYYPKKAMCLQHSAVVTCLLRRRGVPAEMVLGAQEFPPKAHAWAEVLNQVVSDSPGVKTKYRELKRL